MFCHAVTTPPHGCATHTPSHATATHAEKVFKAHSARRKAQARASGGRSSGVFNLNINVYFHVLYSGTSGNVDVSFLDAQIAAMNAGYFNSNITFTRVHCNAHCCDHSKANTKTPVCQDGRLPTEPCSQKCFFLAPSASI